MTDWINTPPAATYGSLQKQFFALRNLVNCLSEQLNHYKNKSYETGERRLKELTESLESERAMNCRLTNDICRLERRHEWKYEDEWHEKLGDCAWVFFTPKNELYCMAFTNPLCSDWPITESMADYRGFFKVVDPAGLEYMLKNAN